MVGYLTTNEDGEFEGSIQGLTAGTYKLKAEFEGDSLYNPSSSVRYFNVRGSSINLSLSSSEQIIEVGDSITITATLTKDGLPFVGEEVEYDIITSSGTTSNSDFTNNAGEISISYTGDGSGDIEIVASYNSLEKRLAIEDCIIYDPLTSDSGKWTIPSSCQTSYDGNGGKFGTATSYSQIKLTDKLTTDCSVEFTVVDYYTDAPNSNHPLIIYQYTNGDTTPNQVLLNGSQTKLAAFGREISGRSVVKNAVYKIDYASSTMKIYENDVVIGTGSNNVGLPTRFEIHIGSSSGRWLKIKDVKVKPL